MFKDLRNKIIIITMAITTAVLIVAGCSIMFFSSTIRPEPKPALELTFVETPNNYSDQELQTFIINDRNEGSTRLLATLLSVGIVIEIIVFLISYYLSEKIVAPVKDSYDKQKVFIANASHELKTPLAVIQANMEALEVDKSSETWKNNIETEITHANKLVLDLLQLAKMDAGTSDKPAPEKVNLEKLITDHIDLFKSKFKGKITFGSSAEAKELTIQKQDFSQALDILLDNATKYGDQKIKVTLNPNELIVANDGATIKKANLEKIFDRFYQTDKTKSGSGLGLAILKSLCDQNSWQITCKSTNKTTKFTLNFA